MKRDLSYLSTCPIAVLGGGAVGKTVAADCKLARQRSSVILA